MGVPGLVSAVYFPQPMAPQSSTLQRLSPTTVLPWMNVGCGWFVTGALGTIQHMDNRVFPNDRPPELASLKGTIDLAGYLAIQRRRCAARIEPPGAYDEPVYADWLGKSRHFNPISCECRVDHLSPGGVCNHQRREIVRAEPVHERAAFGIR
jgi:hypothetical protein